LNQRLTSPYISGQAILILVSYQRCWKKEDMSKAAEDNSACFGSSLENKGNWQALTWEDESFAGYCQCMLGSLLLSPAVRWG
jgi:hypothetical protein